MRIYIIGQVGSGKTTLAKKLSRKYNITHYELDNLIWDDTKGIKRSKKDLQKAINKIKKEKSWLIEDVGRDIFNELYPLCDKIYYLKIPKYILYYRVIKRWFKQILNIEKANYHQDLNSLKQMLKWVNKGILKEPNKLNELKYYNLEIVSFFKYKKMLK